MKFLDPARPTIGVDRPAYPYNKPVAALQAINVRPVRDGFLLTMHLMVEFNSAQEFRKFVTHPSTIGIILEEYADDPERVMRDVFLWPGVKEKKPAAHAVDAGF